MQTAPVEGGTPWSVSDEDVDRFQEDGYLIVPNLFNAQEAALLHKVAKAETNGQKDEHGKQPGMWLLADVDKEDIWNGVVRCRRMVEAMMRFMGDEVYVYHYKMAMKEAANSEIQESGRSNNWEWHQDYGYWYNSGALLPDFASCWIAVDEATRENGCLKVVKGTAVPKYRSSHTEASRSTACA